MRFEQIDSPIGPLLLGGEEHGLSLIHFQGGPRPLEPDVAWKRDKSVFREAIGQLRAYFAGELEDFSLELDPRGTPFQLEVWRALRSIPYGATISYGELARRVGNPAASRAVGAANGRNPLPIVVPCHRVIGANGSLTGFGGGMDIKRQLLDLESGVRDLLD